MNNNRNGNDVFVSLGAESFDPDSILDKENEEEIGNLPPEEDISSSTITSHSHNSSPKPIVILELSPLSIEGNTTVMKVAGILHNLSTSFSKFHITLECLLPYALEFIELGILPYSTTLLSCYINRDNRLNLPSDMSLVQASIKEMSTNKAIVFLEFLKEK